MPLTRSLRATLNKTVAPWPPSFTTNAKQKQTAHVWLCCHLQCQYRVFKTSTGPLPKINSHFLPLFSTSTNLNSFAMVQNSMSSPRRAHSVHSHSHSHSHDNVYLTSSNKKDAGVRITRIGLFVNLGMAIGKGIGGYIFHSQALVADAFHALTDLVSDFMTLATVSWSLRPPSVKFPSGYGKVESLGALGVSGLLLFGGVGMGLNALDALYTQFFVDASEIAQHHGLFSFLHHDHSHGSHLPDINAAWLAAGSIVVKEWLYRASE